MLNISSYITRFCSKRDREEGQALVEYALILGLVTIVCVASVEAVGVSVNNALNAVIGSL